MRDDPHQHLVAALLGAALMAWVPSASAQDTLLDVRTATDAEVATVRTDSMRLAVPLHLLLGGIIFPDGTVQSTAASGTISGSEIEDSTIVDADIAPDAAIQDTKLDTIASPGMVKNSATTATADALPTTIVMRDENGEVTANGLELAAPGPTALRVTQNGSGSAGNFSIANAGNGAAGISVYTAGSGPALRSITAGTGMAGWFLVDNASSSAHALNVGTNGRGNAVSGSHSGNDGSAAHFFINNTGNDRPAMRASTNGGGPAVYGFTSGTGKASHFEISNASNDSAAVSALTDGGGDAVFGHITGTGLHAAVHGLVTGTGMAAFFEIDNSANGRDAIVAATNGAGSAVRGYATGGGSAARLRVNNSTNGSAALLTETNGVGPAIYASATGEGRAGRFRISNTANSSPAVEASTNGGGAALYAVATGSGRAGDFNQTSNTGDILVARNQADIRFRVEYTGNVYADGTFNSGGADLAESFAVEGETAGYEPGDVLVISERTDRTMERATEAYSSRVAGVYATRPGVLLSEHGAEGVPGGEVPVGVVGVIPTKVTVEGGSIRRGDLLVTSSTPGHAMRGEPVTVNGVEIYPSGAVLGKALEPFDGPGTGVIRVLVNVR